MFRTTFLKRPNAQSLLRCDVDHVCGMSHKHSLQDRKARTLCYIRTWGLWNLNYSQVRRRGTTY